MSRKPVDLNIGQSVIQAFAQGREEALARLRNQQAQEQVKIENELKQKAFEEQKRQVQEQLAETKLHNRAQEAMAEAGAALALKQHDVSKQVAGVSIEKILSEMQGIPSGYQDVTSPEVKDKITAQRTTTTPGDLRPQTITKPNPEFERAEALRLKQEADKFVTDQNIREAEGKAKIVGAEFKAKLDQDLLISRENNAAQLEAARMRAAQQEASGVAIDGIAQAVLQNPNLLFEKDAMTPSIRGKVIGELAQLGYNPLARTQEVMQKTANATLQIIDDIKKDKSFTVGGEANIKYQLPGSAYFFPNEYTSAKKLERLVNALAIPELASVNLYPISENDREFLKSLSTYIHYGLPKKNFDQEINRLEGLMKKIQTTPIQVSPMPRAGGSSTGISARKSLESILGQ